jgi:LuxR family transcriptional regulator, maltose regulon positive regulatory protein
MGHNKVTGHHTDRVVQRPRLFERLSSGARVTAVAAPAGSGKTVMLRSWAEHQELTGAVAWVTVDRDEHDPQRFWIAVLNALRATASGSGLVQPLTPAPDLDGGVISERLLRDLAPMSQPLYLVIDDLHELRSPDALQQLEGFLMRSPDPLRLILTARRDLRLGLHRLRLDDQLTEIRASDLRLTFEETAAVLDNTDVKLSDVALKLIDERTEGWAAGVRLAALSLRGHPDPERFAVEFSGSDRTVADYLLAEVLDRQPGEIRNLLLKTAILERVSGPLADHLTGGVDGQRVLQELEGEHAFVVSLDPGRAWFRYHHLFSELLRLELRRTAPEDLTPLNAAAAAWFAERGRWREAIRHAQQAEEWGHATEMLFKQWRSLQLGGQAQVASSLLSRFPGELAETTPELAVLMADEHVSRGASEQALRYLTIAADRAGESAVEAGRLQTEIAVVRLSVARHRGNLPAVIEEAKRLAGNAGGDDATQGPIGEDYRAIALISLGVAELWTAQHQDAERHLEQGIALARLAQRPFLELRGLAHAAFVGGVESLQLAVSRSREAIDLARAHGWEDEPVTAIADTVLAAALVWQGRLEEALDPLERAERNLRASSEPAAAMQVHVSRGMLELARNRYHEAVGNFRKAERLGDAFVSRHMLARHARALLLQAQLHLGELERVDRVLEQLPEVERDSSEMRTTLAALRIAQGDPEEGSRVLAPVLAGSVPLVHRLWRLEPLLVEAISRQAAGEHAASQRALERALDLAEREGVVWPFLVHRTETLLETHNRFRTTHVSLISEILNVASGRRSTARADIEPLTEALSDSETRVLRYLPTNLSAPEIANDLYLSVNTVKTHMRHLYAKLGAHTRAQAVDRARVLGLLAPSTRR